MCCTELLRLLSTAKDETRRANIERSLKELDGRSNGSNMEEYPSSISPLVYSNIMETQKYPQDSAVTSSKNSAFKARPASARQRRPSFALDAIPEVSVTMQISVSIVMCIHCWRQTSTESKHTSAASVATMAVGYDWKPVSKPRRGTEDSVEYALGKHDIETVFATCNDPRIPLWNMFSKKIAQSWWSTGLIPQRILIKFKKRWHLRQVLW